MADSGIKRPDTIEPRRGSAVLLEVLRSEGCRYIFGNPGTTELALMDALLGAPDIGYIWGLQEASAVAMADGYANASGRPGFVNLHTAGGLGHGMGALINAQVSNTLLVVTAGQQDMRHNLTDPLLSGDLVKIAGPAMKWTTEIINPDQIPVLVRRAFHDCTAAPAGPVFLSLPMNVMEQMSTVEIAELSTIDRAAVAGSLDRLSDMLSAIKPGRLALIAGDEISPSGASAEAVAVAEAFGAPVFGSSWPAHIPFPTAHPLWRGNLPTKASEIRAILESYDAIFALGGKSLITICIPTDRRCRRAARSSSSRPMCATSAEPMRRSCPAWATSRRRWRSCCRCSTASSPATGTPSRHCGKRPHPTSKPAVRCCGTEQ